MVKSICGEWNTFPILQDPHPVHRTASLSYHGEPHFHIIVIVITEVEDGYGLINFYCFSVHNTVSAGCPVFVGYIGWSYPCIQM